MELLLYVLVGVGIAAAVGIVMSRRRKGSAAGGEARRPAHFTNDITGVRPGGVLRLPAFGPVPLPFETVVKHRHRYDAGGGSPWYELACEHDGKTLLVEWERDDGELYVSAGFAEGNPRLSDLGLTGDDLERFWEDGDGSFEWDGTRWHLDEASKANYYENERGRPERFRVWDFESADGKRNLGIEKWEGERTYEVFVSWPIEAEDIEVFDPGGGRG